METFEFAVGETLSDRAIAALRWELFVFHEIKDVVRAPQEGGLAILYEGEPRTDEWLRAVSGLGYRVRARPREVPGADAA